jgi:hypothetical protein
MPRRIQSVMYQATGGTASLDGYFDRIIKYIPSDLMGAWVAITGILKSFQKIDPNFMIIQWIVFSLGVIFTTLWTWRQTTEPGKPLAVLQILMSTLAFIVWVIALGGPFATVPGYQEYYGSILLIFFTLAAGLLIPRN